MMYTARYSLDRREKGVLCADLSRKTRLLRHSVIQKPHKEEVEA